jgi:hypothetical protein
VRGPARNEQGFFQTKEEVVNLTAPGIEKFVGVVSRCRDREAVLGSLQFLRMASNYECPSVSAFALHLILDLYDEDSSLQSNINRMTVNLEAAASELLYVNKRIKALR